METVVEMKMGKREKPEENLTNPGITHHICPPGDTEIGTRGPNRDRQSV